jgi:putative transposase
VDLNAMRAGLVKDPKDYRWCGYAEAVSGKSVARKGLGLLLIKEARVIGETEYWRETVREYSKIQFGIGEAQGLKKDEKSPLRRGMTREEVQAVWDAGGKLSMPQLLRCRVRYFTDGVVIGSKAFVERYFEAKREYFGAARASGARRMRGGEWGELRSLRELQKGPVG